MPTIKQNVISLKLVLISSVLMLSFIANANTNKEEKTGQNKMQSIAQPNWWLKSNNNPPKMKMPPKSNVDFKQVKSEPISNFLMVPKSDDWQVIAGSIGISSIKYQLFFQGERYELAVIRMNNKVPLASVLSIWQNKVGIPVGSNVATSDLVTQRKQKLTLYPLIGPQKSILLAVHNQEKYTFFRLSGEKGINQQVSEKFKDFLSSMYITR